tara:strand:+ start:699 stop:893 length:195 start_codon:yes stop_codon:yes gene_type:complete
MSQIITFPPGTFPEPEQQAPSAEALLALLDLLNAQQVQPEAKPKRKIGFVLPETGGSKDEHKHA